MTRQKILFVILISILAVGAVLAVMLGFKRCSVNAAHSVASNGGLPDLDAATRLENIISSTEQTMMYGIDATEYNVESSEIASGQTFSKLLNGKYDVNIAIVNQLIEKCKGKFDLRDLRAGQPYAAFLKEQDSSSTLAYLVYEKNQTEFITFAVGDSLFVSTSKKNITTEERYIEGSIESTLYGSVGALLGNKLADVYESTIDFSAIQKGDKYRILYEKQFIDTTSIGIGKVYGIEITHRGVPYLAIRYEQGETIGYWDGKGNSMKKSFLRAPLSFKARVSSKFGIRVHPIKRMRQQHNGIDYAAPKGTPVLAVADGTVSRKGWDRGGGGNTMWVRHAKNLESGYLHLSRYASGVNQGARVRKGQVIAYVGSTGASTGPHLDFRIKQNGKYINPDKLPSTPGDPINAKSRDGFNIMKSDVLKVMNEYKSQKL